MRRLQLVHVILTSLLLAGAGVFVVLVVSGYVDVRWRSGDVPARDVQAQRREEPQRPPELFGTVEQLRTPAPAAPQFLIRCRQPDPGVAESAQNAWQRQHLPLMWVWVGNQTPVRHRDGTLGQVHAGQTLSVWCSGGMLTTLPPQWGADFVIIER